MLRPFPARWWGSRFESAPAQPADLAEVTMDNSDRESIRDFAQYLRVLGEDQLRKLVREGTDTRTRVMARVELKRRVLEVAA